MGTMQAFPEEKKPQESTVKEQNTQTALIIENNHFMMKIFNSKEWGTVKYQKYLSIFFGGLIKYVLLSCPHDMRLETGKQRKAIAAPAGLQNSRGSGLVFFCTVVSVLS